MCSRIDQLDATSLDGDLLEIFDSLLRKALVHFPYVDAIGPELTTAVKMALIYLTLVRKSSSIGQDLLGLSFNCVKNMRLRLFTLGTIKVGQDYIHQRSQMFTKLISGSSTFNVSKALMWLSTVIKLSGILNSLAFLQQGIYPTLSTRILGLKPISRVQGSRNIDYDYISRELLWHSFIELFIFIIPIINVHRLKNLVARLFPSPGSQSATSDRTSCTSCSSQPVIPSRAGCAHVFCYYCIAANLKADPNFACSSCRTVLDARKITQVRL